jgi:hypothetical protein
LAQARSPGGEEAGGEKAGGEKAGGEKAGGEKAGGEKAGGEEAGGEEAGGEEAGGEEAGERRSLVGAREVELQWRGVEFIVLEDDRLVGPNGPIKGWTPTFSEWQAMPEERRQQERRRAEQRPRGGR